MWLRVSGDWYRSCAGELARTRPLTATGLPVNQLTRLDAPPKEALSESARSARLPLPLLPQTTMQEDVYSLPEGRIVMQWPSALSAESVQEVKDYLNLLERKIVRSTKKKEPA
jgi:hypothetical protein